jgi:hypothetical protein
MLKDLAIMDWNETHFITLSGKKGNKDQFRYEILSYILDQTSE